MEIFGSARQRIVEVVCEIEFVDMGDGTTILDLTLQHPIMVRQRGKAGGLILMASQVWFCPIDTDQAAIMRETLRGLPAMPAPKDPPPWVHDDREGIPSTEDEFPL